MAKSSCLNPLASTFIPSFTTDPIFGNFEPFSEEDNSIKSVALNFIQRVLEIKRERGETSMTKPELLNLIQKLICLRYNITSKPELTWIRAYLSNKIPNVLPLAIKNNESLITSGGNSRTFDFSVYRLPAPTILLVAYFGMYRHEQAFRPLLSLPYRSQALQDDVWSVTEKDLKLWNPCVVKQCSCPPMFGYSVPAGFFGNPFNLKQTCSMQEIHLSRTEDTEEGNEAILQEPVHNYPISEVGFMEFDEKLTAKADLDYYAKQLKEIVSSVCNLIDELETKEVEDWADEGYSANDYYLDSLWNKDNKEVIARPLVDDDHHPLLDVEFKEEPEINDVSLEIKELLRRSLSNENDLDVPSPCDPPCSVWCSDHSKSDTKPDSTAIDMLNETTQFVTGISSEPQVKPCFKRSYSHNDCDPSYDWKYGPTSRLSSRLYSRRVKSESWKGIVTQWSSHEEENEAETSCRAPMWTLFSGEDVFEEAETSCRAPMWTLFSGEDSLWKPLPVSEQAKLAPHKRIRDLRRQSSTLD